MNIELSDDERQQLVLGQARINIQSLLALDLPQAVILDLERTDYEAQEKYEEVFQKVDQSALIQKLDPNREFALEGAPIPVV